MDNYLIADQLSLLSKLMDIHGENAFKAKSYSIAAFALEKLETPVADLAGPQIARQKNIGESVSKKIIELLETGEMQELKEIIKRTPTGIVDMMSIKGLGPKKIHTLWKELNIDSLEELQRACEEKRLSATKGFGEKTEQKILDSLAFKKANSGKYLYVQIEAFAESITEKLRSKFPDHKTIITGEFRRQMEVINQLEWVTTIDANPLQKFLVSDSMTVADDDDEQITLLMETGFRLVFHLCTSENLGSKLLLSTGDETFVESLQVNDAPSEEEIFQSNNVSFIVPALRHKHQRNVVAPMDLIQLNQVKGLIHCHSDWSDGGHSIEEMATALINLGFEYMVISDHSKAAYYANGLTEERIQRQHKYVDELNEQLAPFKIFKSIECDILGDGSLDYTNDVLSTFDLVITSIHSNLDMTEEKAMARLLGAITNPYTTILGHMTGRLLLKRSGYPVDYRVVIDSCAENNVVIEINANPKRLDMDWRWIDYAISRGVMLSIDPDAHTVDEFQLLKYGVLVAQKGGLTSQNNLSSFSLAEFENFLKETKQKKLQ